MSPDTKLPARNTSDQAAAAAFNGWIRRVVKGAAELRALDDGELDAVMDPATGSAILLPEARLALNGSSRVVRGVFDVLPGQVCVLDSAGTVIMANDAWRAFGARHGGAGLSVREGDNFLAACRTAERAERKRALAVGAGLRQVLMGARLQFRYEYVCDTSAGHCTFTLLIAQIARAEASHVVVTRDNIRECKRPRASPGPDRTGRRKFANLARADVPNRLLAALPAQDYERLRGGLEPVTLTYGEALYEPGQQMRHVYFPSDCVVSLLTVVEGHRALEVGLVGREGMVGSRLALGITQSSVRALVQGTGSAVRMGAARFMRVFRQSPALQRTLFQFTDTLMNQVSQTAACNCFHVVEERLARWLLMTRERLPAGEFHLTHEFLADMLGVRRVGVTTAASSLQRQKLIRYRRGNIRILDQKGLEAAACACYQHVRIRDPEAGSG
ncbi:MAG TPA: Crp/Fnr family transcriptional regulator [Steroidobacteraceae bacterium]